MAGSGDLSVRGAFASLDNGAAGPGDGVAADAASGMPEMKKAASTTPAKTLVEALRDMYIRPLSVQMLQRLT